MPFKIVEASFDFKEDGFTNAVEISEDNILGSSGDIDEKKLEELILSARSRGGIGGIIKDQGAGEMILIQIEEDNSQYLFPVDDLKDGLEDFFLA